jgi:flagellar hook assembly protein FlgD
MMKYFLRGAGTAVFLLALVLGCQTAQPMAPTESAIQVESSGFSPHDTSGQNTIEISLLFGNSESIKSWKVEVMRMGVASRTWTGTASPIPASLRWDGSTDAGGTAVEGSYTARLSIDYAAKYQPATAESRSFVLDLTPPTGSITLNPTQFTPRADGVKVPVILTINAHSALAHMESWSLDVFAETGGLVKSWSGEWPNASVTWDGSTMTGGYVAPGAMYSVISFVRDEYGNSAELTSKVEVANLPMPATPAPAPIPRDPSIVALAAGFSPNGDHVADLLMLDLNYGKQPAEVSEWGVRIIGSNGEVLKSWTGQAAGLPGRLEWDGKSDSGAMALEGVYKATFNVTYEGSSASRSATSASFVLDLTPPTGEITLSSDLFSPIESSDTITLRLSARSKLAKIDSWTMDIRDPGGRLFRSFSSKWPESTATWDGRSTRGDMVESAEDYTVVARVRDQFGITGYVRAMVPIDILMEKTATGYRILASRIFFKAFTADYTHVTGGLAEQNVARLNNLAAKLTKFPGYKIRIVGHAVMINWDRPEAGKIEQRTVLIPLSKARADAVEAALVDRGLDKSRFTMEGVGASDQLVPDSNYMDRWRNRRVAFFLDN